MLSTLTIEDADKPQPPDYPARQQHHLEDVLQGEHEQDDSQESDCNGDHDEQTRERSLWHECRASPCGARGVLQHDSELIEDGTTSSATESPASLAYSASSPGSNAEELLHLEQAHTALDEPGREGVPDGVIGGATVPFDLSGVPVAPGPARSRCGSPRCSGSAAHPLAVSIAAVELPSAA